MILPKVRDPRFVTIRRGGTLTDSDHQLLALWAASCAEHVLNLFESARPEDTRPREAIEHARAWVRGEVKMMQARAAGGHAMGAARDLRGAARHAAYAAGQAGAVAHVAAHELGAAAYAIKAARAAAPEDEGEAAGRRECRWQRDQLPRRFASSYSTTSGCGTTSAGRCSTAEGTHSHPKVEAVLHIQPIGCMFWVCQKQMRIRPMPCSTRCPTERGATSCVACWPASIPSRHWQRITT